MPLSRTRKLLVKVARELFARKGFEATTMNDIALASCKGRRTLYTYFRNKEEIYSAVISSELDRLNDRLNEVAAMDLSPEQKMLMLIYTHLQTIKEAVVRNGNLRAEFFRNIWMVEKVRRRFDTAERDTFRRVMQEGCDKAKFRIEDVNLYADITQYCLKGLEVPYIYGRLGRGLTDVTSRPIVAGLVRRALGMPDNYSGLYEDLERLRREYPEDEDEGASKADEA